MTANQIQTIGNLLAYYETDLEYIRRFQHCKIGKLHPEEYYAKSAGSLYNFLVEFRVIRNFSKGSIDKMFSETIKWVNGNNPNDVDAFALELSKTNLTRTNITTSLASKILFLNNPWDILPMDKLTRTALAQNENNYSIYCEKLNGYRVQMKEQLEECLNFTSPVVYKIHQRFPELQNLETIHHNRLLDKFLWTVGKTTTSK